VGVLDGADLGDGQAASTTRMATLTTVSTVLLMKAMTSM